MRQLETLATAAIAAESWANYGEIVVCADEAAMIAYSDHVAAEHLQVHTADPKAFAKRLRNYGSLFIGENASVVYSDKYVGTNHTLPTMGAGRYTGGLWVGSYVKIATHQWLDDSAIRDGRAARDPPERQRGSGRPPEGGADPAGAPVRLRPSRRSPRRQRAPHAPLSSRKLAGAGSSVPRTTKMLAVADEVLRNDRGKPTGTVKVSPAPSITAPSAQLTSTLPSCTSRTSASCRVCRGT